MTLTIISEQKDRNNYKVKYPETTDNSVSLPTKSRNTVRTEWQKIVSWVNRCLQQKQNVLATDYKLL